MFSTNSLNVYIYLYADTVDVKFLYKLHLHHLFQYLVKSICKHSAIEHTQYTRLGETIIQFVLKLLNTVRVMICRFYNGDTLLYACCNVEKKQLQIREIYPGTLRPRRENEIVFETPTLI